MFYILHYGGCEKMKRKHIGLVSVMALTAIILVNIISCNHDIEKATQRPVHYVEASWVRGYRTIDELCANKEIQVIAIGKVHRVVEVINENNYLYTTRFAFRIENLLKGDNLKEIIVSQIGSPDNSGFQFRDDPLFDVGKRYLLFLKKNDNNIYFTPGPWGRYQIIDNKVYSLNNTLTDKKAYQAPVALDFNGADIAALTEDVIEILDTNPTASESNTSDN